MAQAVNVLVRDERAIFLLVACCIQEEARGNARLSGFDSGL
jgi:hypothetical protein